MLKSPSSSVLPSPVSLHSVAGSVGAVTLLCLFVLCRSLLSVLFGALLTDQFTLEGKSQYHPARGKHCNCCNNSKLGKIQNAVRIDYKPSIITNDCGTESHEVNIDGTVEAEIPQGGIEMLALSKKD